MTIEVAFTRPMRPHCGLDASRSWPGVTSRHRGWRCPALLLLVALLTLSPGAWAKRVALVFGNAAYQHEGALRNPVRDAELLQRTLQSAPLNFDQVMILRDGTRAQMLQQLAQFKRIAAGADVALAYYSGHGMLNEKKQNFMLPIDMPKISADAGLDVDAALRSYAVSEDDLIDALEGAQVQVAILDACRDNGFRGDKSGTKGLGRRPDQRRNRLIAYATEEGRVAVDGSGPNSPYATSLAKHLVRTDWPLLKVFDEVSSDVERATRTQLPTRSGNLRTDVYLLASLRPEPVPAPVAPMADPEQEAWELAKRRDTVAGYQAYINRYSQGRFVDPARVALEGLQSGPSPAVAKAAAQPVQQAQGGAQSAALRPGQAFRDCQDAHCPELVVIPAGRFTMGSNDFSGEKPTRSVGVSRFALGKYEVTQGQWKAVMGSDPSGFKECGDNCPVESVSWDDVQQFLQKLNQMTGQRYGYRLPTEAEWEYAARAGTNTKYWWGDRPSRDHANYGKELCCDGHAEGRDRWVNTAPVGQFPANPFGLHDMHGNVWEWVQDVWHGNYAGAPLDASAWVSGGDQSLRVLRGGSWGNDPGYLRSTYRIRDSSDVRSNYVGFRIARTVP